jgi:rubrerythrin
LFGEKEMEQALDRRMINILRKAIQSERTSYKRYILAESCAQSDEEKKIYRSLAEEEMKHEEIILGRMRDIKKAIGLDVLKKEEVKEAAPKKAKKSKKKEE